jgi:hypothetical protein
MPHVRTSPGIAVVCRLDDRRHLDANDHCLSRPVIEPLVAEHRPLGALKDDAKSGLHDEVIRLLYVIRPKDGQSFDRGCERALSNLSVRVPAGPS